jgi:hypothetical protein
VSTKLENVLNKDKIRDLHRQYRSQSKEKKKEHYRQYNIENKSAIRESKRQYFRENEERKKEHYRQYRLFNKDKIRDSKRLYHFRRHANPESYLPRSTSNKSWRDSENVRKYFDSIAEQLRISIYSDWYRISRFQVKDLEGVNLLVFIVI